MSQTVQHLLVADSLPGAPLKVSKTLTVGMTVDARGDVRFKLVARPANRRHRPSPKTILAARKAAGLTQKAAAEKCLASVTLWRAWEHGKRSMPPALWRMFFGLAGR